MPTPPAFLAALSPETPLVQPFALKSASQFRPDAPPALDSRLWARDYNEIKALGSLVGSTRTAEQTDIGRFWSDHPPLQWVRAWRALSVGSFLRTAENARYFAMLSTASADALIACWDAKYLLQLLAAGDGDSSRRHRWQSEDRTRQRVDWAGGHSQSSRVSVRAWLRERGDHDNAGSISSGPTRSASPSTATSPAC